MARSAVLLLLSCLAAASAFMLPPSVPLRQQALASSRSTELEMGKNSVVRIEIELEQGEP